jgi:hypothetical protein
MIMRNIVLCLFILAFYIKLTIGDPGDNAGAGTQQKQ